MLGEKNWMLVKVREEIASEEDLESGFYLYDSIP